MIETKEIKMPSKKLLSVLFMKYGMGWVVAAVTGIIVFIVLGLAIDLRFLMLAMIWIFLLVPLVMAFLYFYYGMMPLTAFNSIPHKVLIDENDLSIQLESEKEEELDSKETKIYKVPLTLYKETIAGSNYVILLFNKKGLAWLPIDGFENYSEFKEALSLVNINK